MNTLLDRTELKQVRNYIVDRLEMDEVEPDEEAVLDMIVRKFEDRFPLDDSEILGQVRWVVEEELVSFVEYGGVR